MEKEIMIRLVQKAQAGDHKALEKLFDGFYNDVYYFALKTLQDQELACDITQETFLQVIQSIGQLQEPAAFPGWLKQIAYHQCTGYFKKKKEALVEEDEDGNTVFDRLEDEGELPQEILEQEEFRQTILSMVEQLTEEQRTAVMLYYYDEMSVAEIAEIQGVSTGTVKSRLNYARKSLKNSVESYEKKHGIKLRCVGFLPLIMLLFGKEVMPAKAVKTVRGAVSAAAKAAMGGASAISGAVVAAVSAVLAAAVAIGGGIAVAKNWNPPEPEEPAVIQQSQNDPLVLGNVLMELPEDFYVFAPNARDIFYTQDGGVRHISEPETDLPFKRSDVLYSYTNCLVYADSQGTLHVWQQEGSVPLPGVSGEPFLVAGGYTDPSVLLLQDDGSMQYAQVFPQGVSIAPMQFQDMATGAVYDRADHVRAMVTPEYATVYIYKDDMVYYGKVDSEVHDETMYTLRLTGVKAVSSADLLGGIDNGFAYFTREDPGTIYLSSGPVKLPEGQTAENITWFYSADVTMVKFATEQVYVCGSGMDGFAISQTMTDLLISDQLRSIDYIASGNYLILQLQDGRLYRPVVRTQIPG